MRTIWHRLFPVLAFILPFFVFLSDSPAFATGGFYVIGSTAVATITYTQSGNTYTVSTTFSSTWSSGRWQNGSAAINPYCSSDTNGSNLVAVGGNSVNTRFFLDGTVTSASVPCPAGSPLLYKVIILDTTGSTPYPTVVDWRTNSPNTPTTCPSSAWNTVTASYVSGNVSINVQYTNGTAPTGINVYIPDPQAPTNGTGYAARLAPVAGSPNYFYAKFALASAPASARLAPIGNEACYLAMTAAAFGNVGDAPSGQTDYGATDGDTGISCGWNPFCYIKAAIKWAFFPTDGDMTQWSNKITSIKTHFPVNLIVGGITLVNNVVDCAKYEDNVGPTTITDTSHCGSVNNSVPNGPYGVNFNPLDWINHTTIVNSASWWITIRAIEVIAIWGGTVLVIWSVVSANFGGKDA